MLKYHIQTIEVGSGGAGSITFSNIPQDYDELQIVSSARGSDGTGYGRLVFNSGLEATKRRLYGTGSSVGSDTTSVTDFRVNGSDQTASTFSNSTIIISNYSSSSQYKSYSVDSVNENNTTYGVQQLVAGLVSTNTPISTVSLVIGGGSYTQYSSASLYGIKRGDSGELDPASGGTITTSGGYTIHTFTASGTFVVNRNLNADVLVVAGGGGGGMNDGAGGGGGGGYLYSEGASVTAGSYTVTVGSGGAGATTGGTDGGKGVNSSLGSLLVAEGGGYGARGYNSNGTVGGNGGSGGGGGIGVNNTASLAGGTGSQGYPGGASAYQALGGGGGGAGSAGAQGSGSTSGKGGDGVLNSISGTGVYYAAGAAGGIWYDSGKRSAPASLGGAQAGFDGTANEGDGGGGGGNYVPVGDAYGGNGGSGIVIIRYPTPA